MLAKKYKADIFTYFFEETKTFKELKSFNISESCLQIKIPLLKQLLAKNFFKRLNLEKNYDIILMYGFYSIFSAEKNHPNIWLAAAPPKNLFLPEYYKAGNLIRNAGMKIFRTLILKEHVDVVKNHLDMIFAVSNFQKRNIEKIYERRKNLKVIYPPVETKKFYYKPAEDYYLTVSRLEPLKRVDIIIKAFMKMPDKKLVVVGDGSQRKYLEKLAKGNTNIQFTGPLYGKSLLELYAKCIAFIFMSKQEDFGIVPVEAMAAGKPVIAANEGGPKETVVNGRTGILIKPTVKSLIKAVKWLTPEKAEKMKEDCQKRAELFDSSVYFSQVDKIIREMIK